MKEKYFPQKYRLHQSVRAHKKLYENTVFGTPSINIKGTIEIAINKPVIPAMTSGSEYLSIFLVIISLKAERTVSVIKAARYIMI